MILSSPLSAALLLSIVRVTFAHGDEAHAGMNMAVHDSMSNCTTQDSSEYIPKLESTKLLWSGLTPAQDDSPHQSRSRSMAFRAPSW